MTRLLAAATISIMLPLVSQLHFARSEFKRCLDGLSDADARTRFEPMNCISWMVGHLADQEHRYWTMWLQHDDLLPELNDLVGYGKPASTPPLADMWAAWEVATKSADRYFATITQADVDSHFTIDGQTSRATVGQTILRNIYHYWFHIGEAHAVRQQLGHTDLPDFVGRMTHVKW